MVNTKNLSFIKNTMYASDRLTSFQVHIVILAISSPLRKKWGCAAPVHG